LPFLQADPPKVKQKDILKVYGHSGSLMDSLMDFGAKGDIASCVDVLGRIVLGRMLLAGGVRITGLGQQA
jgi:hypothetical protein